MPGGDCYREVALNTRRLVAQFALNFRRVFEKLKNDLADSESKLLN